MDEPCHLCGDFLVSEAVRMSVTAARVNYCFHESCFAKASRGLSTSKIKPTLLGIFGVDRLDGV